MARDVRHAARAHAGAGQAGGGAGAAGAAAAARGAAADGARVGDARRCPRPTAPERWSSRSTCGSTRRSSSTAAGRVERVPLTPHRPVGDVTQGRAGRGARLARPVEIDPTPQEVAPPCRWTRTRSTQRYDPDQVAVYFTAATQAALVLAAFRGALPRPLHARQRVVGVVDLAVSLFSGGHRPILRSDDFIMRNAMDGAGGRRRLGGPPTGVTTRRRFTPTRTRRPRGSPSWPLSPPAAHWDAALGEYVLELGGRPHRRRSARDRRWSSRARRSATPASSAAGIPALAASAEGTPPPVA